MAYIGKGETLRTNLVWHSGYGTQYSLEHIKDVSQKSVSGLKCNHTQARELCIDID